MLRVVSPDGVAKVRPSPGFHALGGAVGSLGGGAGSLGGVAGWPEGEAPWAGGAGCPVSPSAARVERGTSITRHEPARTARSERTKDTGIVERMIPPAGPEIERGHKKARGDYGLRLNAVFHESNGEVNARGLV